MSDTSASELLNDIRSAQATSYGWLLGLVIAIAAAVTSWSLGYHGLGAGLFAVGVVVAIAIHVIQKKFRVVRVDYSLDPDYQAAYEALISAFQRFAVCEIKWSLESEAAVIDKKYAGGADRLIRRVTCAAKLELPKVMRSSLKPPMLTAGRQTIYFMPDTVLVFEARGVGAVPYSDLSVECGTTQQIERGPVPSDSRVVGKTWEYVNKRGGPDKRFKDNRELPIILVGRLAISSESGVNEEFQTSSPEAPVDFATALQQMARHVNKGTGRRPAATRYPV